MFNITQKMVNPAFHDFLFDWEQKFQLLVGGYGSSKSYHVATKLVLKLLEEKRTCLVIRSVYSTLKESCFSLIKEIVDDLNLNKYVRYTTSPLEVKFANGSKIIFRGTDDPQKLKSINNVSLVWAEECSELSYEAYKELLGRLRHPKLKLHMILSTNPVSQENWVYKHFFKDEENNMLILDDEELYKEKVIVKDNTYYHHSTAEDNKFLPMSYLEQLEEMKLYDPDLYRIAREGRFGVNGIKVLPQFEIMDHKEVVGLVNRIPDTFKRIGMDFGFVTSYNCLMRVAIDHERKWLYIYSEYYSKGKTDDITAREIEDYKDELIIADSSEPKAIAYYNQQGFKMIGAKKGPGSVLANIKKIKRFRRIICSTECKNAIRELKNLTYAKDRKDAIIENELSIDSHCFDAIAYALNNYEVTDIKDRKNFSGKGARN